MPYPAVATAAMAPPVLVATPTFPVPSGPAWLPCPPACPPTCPPSPAVVAAEEADAEIVFSETELDSRVLGWPLVLPVPKAFAGVEVTEVVAAAVAEAVDGMLDILDVLAELAVRAIVVPDPVDNEIDE